MTKMNKLVLLSGLLLAGCNDSVKETTSEVVPPIIEVTGGTPVELPIIDANVRHDTLLVQVAFAVGDGTFLMVASNVTETFEGLRLYHYKALPDSSADVISVSAPGYDSWTMLPTVFGKAGTLNGTWIMANFGERRSWGQKLMWYEGAFEDRGFMDIAFPERVTEADTSYLKLTNIAPHVRMTMHSDTTTFTLACDSVYLYDDLDGHYDIVQPANTVRYTYHPKTGLVLWVDGSARTPPAPPA